MAEQSHDIIKRLEEENSALKKQLLLLETELTPGKNNEAKRVDNESIFRYFFDNSVDGLFLVDPDGIVKE